MPDPAPDLTGRKLAFVVTEDWFFASHFLPMARAARGLGLDVAVVTRVRDHRDAIEAAGARVLPLEAERRSLNPLAAGYAAGR
ncbi:MAG TPA: glycosyltransferase family 1 protein, partial [Microvirga sp.]|nr:glycosyltransferase family 1 protein [Microvirga sp.]